MSIAAVLETGEQGSSLVGSSSLAAYIQVCVGEVAKRDLWGWGDARQLSTAAVLETGEQRSFLVSSASLAAYIQVKGRGC